MIDILDSPAKLGDETNEDCESIVYTCMCFCDLCITSASYGGTSTVPFVALCMLCICVYAIKVYVYVGVMPHACCEAS